MMILVTYDVDFTHKNGAARLRKVAAVCSDYGVRVQNSVFEMLIDSAQLEKIKQRLGKIIDEDHDSIRIYHLGKRHDNKIEVMGRLPEVVQDDTLML